MTKLDKDTIRTILLANGFTIKEGQTDLKPYVYQAIIAVLGSEGAQRLADKLAEQMRPMIESWMAELPSTLPEGVADRVFQRHANHGSHGRIVKSYADGFGHIANDLWREVMEDIARTRRQQGAEPLAPNVPAPNKLSLLELYRQWFNQVQDLNPNYLEVKDYCAAQQLYQALDMRVPHSIEKVATGAEAPPRNGNK